MKNLVPKPQFSTTFDKVQKPNEKDLGSSIANPKNSIEIWKNSIQNMKNLIPKTQFSTTFGKVQEPNEKDLGSSI